MEGTVLGCGIDWRAWRRSIAPVLRSRQCCRMDQWRHGAVQVKIYLQQTLWLLLFCGYCCSQVMELRFLKKWSSGWSKCNASVGTLVFSLHCWVTGQSKPGDGEVVLFSFFSDFFFLVLFSAFLTSFPLRLSAVGFVVCPLVVRLGRRLGRR